MFFNKGLGFYWAFQIIFPSLLLKCAALPPFPVPPAQSYFCTVEAQPLLRQLTKLGLAEGQGCKFVEESLAEVVNLHHTSVLFPLQQKSCCRGWENLPKFLGIHSSSHMYGRAWMSAKDFCLNVFKAFEAFGCCTR